MQKQNQENQVLYPILKQPVALAVRTIWRPRLVGAHRIPARGAVILASNHQSLAETVMMPSLMRRTVHFLAKSDFFRGGSPLNTAFAMLLRGLNVMPVDRSGGRASSTALEAGLEVLRAGKVLGIYPEGTRSPDGRMYRGKTGVARLALATGAPVVPVAMVGAWEAQRGRRILPRRSPRIDVLIGEPLDAADVIAKAGAEEATEAERLRLVTDEIMGRIRSMSGQDYVDEYAADVKRRLRAERDAA